MERSTTVGRYNSERMFCYPPEEPDPLHDGGHWDMTGSAVDGGMVMWFWVWVVEQNDGERQ